MTVKTALVQPPLWPDAGPAMAATLHRQTVERGLAYVDQALAEGAQIVALPEYFGVIMLDRALQEVRASASERVLAACRERVARSGATILCPTIEFTDHGLFNTTVVLTPEGDEEYRKTHLTLSEREQHGLREGDELGLFTTQGLSLGVATCYDMYFPELARILAIRGARAIFFPALQRAEPRENVQLQVRGRAYDNCVHVARIAFGYPAQTEPRTDINLGGTCVADWDGKLVADLGVHEGILLLDLPTGAPPLRRRSFEGEPQDPSRYLFEDRRPELYAELVAPLKTVPADGPSGSASGLRS